MYSDGSALAQLSRDDCVRLLASVPVGRVIYTRRALPAVDLVNFAFDSDEIVIRTDAGGKLAAAARGAVVAFEADCLDAGCLGAGCLAAGCLDPARHAGWSVTAIGPSREVTDLEELARLRELGLICWAPGTQEHFIKISPQLLTGRHLSADGPSHPSAGRNGHVLLAG